MPRGGRRSGKSGKAYSNRMDLNAVPTNLPYGERKQREGQLAAMPHPTSGAAPVAPASAGVAPARRTPTPMDAPTQRPGEPLTTGLPTGPGGGPEALGLPTDPVSNLRKIYAQYPTEDLRALLEDMEGRAV